MIVGAGRLSVTTTLFFGADGSLAVTADFGAGDNLSVTTTLLGAPDVLSAGVTTLCLVDKGVGIGPLDCEKR
jgi:hypothetical protein